MQSLFVTGLTLLTSVALAAGGWADDAKKEDRGKTDPEGVPLELRIVAKKSTYALDLGGQTAAKFRDQLKEAEKSGNYPAPPAVELTLELRNTGEKEVQVWVSGDPTKMTLELKGMGAVNAAVRKAFTREFRAPKPVTLAPGKSHQFPLTSLTHGFRGVAEHAYWTEPGDYLLTASFRTAVSPAPKDAKDARNGFGYVIVTSAPVKLKVEGK